MNKKELIQIINLALKEDIGSGDITTNLIIPDFQKGIAEIFVKEDGVIAGLNVANEVFKRLNNKITFRKFIKEGDKVSKGTKIAEVKGSLRALLTGERTALNFLQRMSGIATFTSKFVAQLEGLNTKILDTRKTVPCLRMLDKYSVKVGGGTNHRFGLYDMVLIKDNHIKAAGSITKAVQLIRKKLKKKVRIEVETTNLDEVKEALSNKVDIIMLDNMSLKLMEQAVKLIDGKAKVEASGNVTLQNVRKIALTGVDFISAGVLTHSVKALDISMKIQKFNAELGEQR
ncbi:MAG: carboxylating nicotinate-nucleotide diphosphorylase [Melioribacter sp.]|uniref:carboxylating nicotinate-nucleotide diphosphorylase n=1 Tax=Rosettibacter primus TaxID=3111523 RepID=UPI00247BCB9A|nr:carboxylating nicotinate-nucleotide diphosphorylase [Melioribacter sp.]